MATNFTQPDVAYWLEFLEHLTEYPFSAKHVKISKFNHV